MPTSPTALRPVAVREVGTPHGPARLHRFGRGSAGAPTLVLGHGAGGGIEGEDLQVLAAAVVARGFAAVLVEQPWRVAGRRIAPRPEVLDVSWLTAVGSLRLRGPLVVGGRSAGARVACRTARALDAAGVVALAFPLHPPGRPGRSRADELARCPGRPIVIQGTQDPFGTAAEVRAAAPRARVAAVEGGDHGLRRGDLGPGLAAVLRMLDRCRE